MMTLSDYAQLILTGKSFRYQKTPELMEYLNKKTDQIYSRDIETKATPRTRAQVYSHTKNMASEFALASLSSNLSMSLKEHNHRDKHTYAYDVVYNDANNNINHTFEHKRWNNSDTQNWFSYSHKNLKTFFDNTDIVDYFVSGRLKDYDDYFEIGFYLVANAKTFKRYWTPSQRENADPYYSHRIAMKDGECYFTNVKFEEPGYGKYY